MKNITITLILLIGLTFTSFSQKTYYNPSNKVDLTITIKESYKPVDYSKIGRDFNTMIQNEERKREELIRYYDEIFFETKRSVINNTVLTSDNLINSKILMVQRKIIQELDLYNQSWRDGLLKTKDFESNVRNIYYTYMENNQVFLQIVQYKYNKDLELNNEVKINEHNQIYTKTLNSIKYFKINNLGEIEFYCSNLVYPKKNTSNNLFDFVTRFGEEKFKPHNLIYDESQIEKDKLISFREQVLKIRKRKLSQFIKIDNEREIRELEFQFYHNVLKELQKIDPRLKGIKLDTEITYFLIEDENFICSRLLNTEVFLSELHFFSISNILIFLIEDFWEDPTRTSLSQKEIESIKNLPYWK
jgi:hypothetical protein